MRKELGLAHPYLLSDVEVLTRAAEFECDLREELHRQCKQLWVADAHGPSQDLLPLPSSDGSPLRDELRSAQSGDGQCESLRLQLQGKATPRRSKQSPALLSSFRLAPDAVLEKHVSLALSSLWVPVIPDCRMAFTAERLNWRRWLFLSYHETLQHSHRPFVETHQLVRRTGYWDAMATDISQWCGQCQVCLQFRSTAVLPPMRSILADDQLLEVLPWTDVIVDVQGPYTRAENGEQYVVS